VIGKLAIGLVFIAAGCAAEIDGVPSTTGGGANGCGNTVQALRRLTQTEYDNTIRDLLGDTSQPATAFPADSRNLGFDNNLETLSTPPALVTGYEAAAETLIDKGWARDSSVSPTAWLRVCDPASAGRDCAQQIVGRFARKAWRRPVGDDEVKSLMTLVDTAAGQGDDLVTGTKLALRGVLLSPNFVFHTEVNAASSDHALASRLSYFLWSSMPDDDLINQADAGTLHQPDVLKSQVQRMLADPKAQALVDSFAGQWLYTLDMPQASPNPTLFPKVTPSLKQAMHDETSLFFKEFLRGDTSALALLNADFTYLNQELADYYGVPGVQGSAMQRVPLPAGSHRGGLLTQAGILMVTSFSERTSAVRRGQWVLNQLWCQAPPPPPPGIPPLPATPPPGATQRQLLENHAQDPKCSGCHESMDAVGFGLENFDAAGQWRTVDNGTTIDVAGALSGKSFDGALALEQVIKGSPSLPACLTSTVYAYAVGRSVDESDQAAIAALTQDFVANGATLSGLFAQVATSSAITQRCAAANAQ